MAKRSGILSDFSLEATDFSTVKGHPDQAILNKDFGMVLNVGPFRKDIVNIGQPYRLVEGRILVVTKGHADFGLNLEDRTIKEGDVILLVPETVMELKACTEDFNMIGVIYKVEVIQPQFQKDFPVEMDNMIFHPQDSGRRQLFSLLGILWDIASRSPFPGNTVNNLLAAIISVISDLNIAEQERHPAARLSRGEQLFTNFKKLVSRYCTTQRNIPFYAEKLFVSPHHLSSVISKTSGKSVMYWINRAVILQAKVMLKSKDLMIYEVADKLNFPNQSFFSKFFKRETGLTPLQYQKMQSLKSI